MHALMLGGSWHGRVLLIGDKQPTLSLVAPRPFVPMVRPSRDESQTADVEPCDLYNLRFYTIFGRVYAAYVLLGHKVTATDEKLFISKGVLAYDVQA